MATTAAVTSGMIDVAGFGDVTPNEGPGDVCNIGHFDSEIQADLLNSAEGVKRNIKPQVNVHMFASRQLDLHAGERPPR